MTFLFNDAASDVKVGICDWLIEEDVDGGSHSSFYDTVLALVHKNWGKQ
jgi:hypothetical protein